MLSIYAIRGRAGPGGRGRIMQIRTKSRLIILVAAVACAAAPTFGLSGCAGTRLSKSTGEYIDDAALTAKVKAELFRDPIVSGMQVNVDTYKGIVQLNGFVDTPQEKARAEQIARNVPGVSGVQNKLSVKTNLTPNQ